MEKVLGVSIETQRNPAQLSIISVLLDVKDLEAVSVLNEPDVVRLLNGLAGSLDRVDSNVLIVFSLPRTNDDDHMHIVLDANVPQFCHKSVLQLKLFEAFRLLR